MNITAALVNVFPSTAFTVVIYGLHPRCREPVDDHGPFSNRELPRPHLSQDLFRQNFKKTNAERADVHGRKWWIDLGQTMRTLNAEQVPAFQVTPE